MSYIRIVCSKNTNPKSNKLQLRTEPPTFIELTPGVNILRVNNYPALKYGFSQIDDFSSDNWPIEYNGKDIIEIDLSHFDGAAMTSMDYMFSYMSSLKKIVFGESQMFHPSSANSAFERVGEGMEVLDLTSIDFSKTKDTSRMLYGVSANTIDLSGADFSSIKDFEEMFTGIESECIVLDRGTYSSIKKIIDLIPFKDGFIEKISLEGCSYRFIETVATATKLSGRDISLCLKNCDIKTTENDCLIIKKRTFAANNNSKTCYNVVSEIGFIPNGTTQVLDGAFKNCTSLKYAILPDTINSIGNNVFENCYNLECINIPDSVTKIGEDVFKGCSNLKQLCIPDNVEDIGSLASLSLDFLRIPLKLIFTGCLKFTRIKTLIISKNREYKTMTIDGERHLSFLNAMSPQYLNSDEWPNIILESDNSDFHSGMVIDLSCDPESEIWPESMSTLFSLPSHILAIPSGVQNLRAKSICPRKAPLYIPDSVSNIEKDAFSDALGYKYPTLVTSEWNYNHLKDILPVSMKFIRIITI